MSPRPRVAVLVGSPRRHGNTAFAAAVAVEELERRGVACETVMLCEMPLSLSDTGIDSEHGDPAHRRIDELIERVWTADGLILATPIYFSNVSAQMKAFMDATNDRYLRRDWLAPRTIGLMAIGGQGGFKATIEALRRYLDHVAPGRPPVEVATGRADAAGEAEQSQDVREAARSMAARMAQALMG